MAISAGIPAVAYAKNLLSFAVHGADPDPIGAGMAGSDLHERIRTLLASQSCPTGTPTGLTMVGLALCGVGALTSFATSLRPPDQHSGLSRLENAALRLQANPFPAD
jgi:hypothetical protein